MESLSKSVYDYYCRHFDWLQPDKQLHFASRLFLWSGDQFGGDKLAELRPAVTHDEDPAAALGSVYAEAQATIHHGSKNAAALRAPYFQKYPRLRTLAMLLFRLTFLKSIYGLDARKALFELMPQAEIEEMLENLLGDDAALAILSTHAINVLYLYNRVVLENDATLDPSHFLTVGAEQYDLADPVHLQLYIYLYTHCIIGESRFYERRLPERYLPVYRQMLDELEAVIEAHFTAINLDNKFEFLVCCELVGYTSNLRGRIMAEAELSVSDEGSWLVDKHNSNPQTANSSLDASEHRNVLFIMANRPKS